MFNSLIGFKVGMTQVFGEDGRQHGVTVIKIDNCKVFELKNLEKHGYESVVLATSEVKPAKLKKPQRVVCEKKGLGFFKEIKEFRISGDCGLKEGDLLKADLFNKGDCVDVISISKGKGFAGVMKRWNFGGLRASHGVSLTHRSHGSTGNRQDPGRVFKNKKMAGHLGSERVTIKNLIVVDVDLDLGVLLIKGSVPGGEGSVVYLNKVA